MHPTQLYEAMALVPLMMLLLGWRRRRRPEALVLGGYLFFAGAIRFAIEFLRINERVLGPLTVAHLASVAAMIAGAAFVLRWRVSAPQ